MTLRWFGGHGFRWSRPARKIESGKASLRSTTWMWAWPDFVKWYGNPYHECQSRSAGRRWQCWKRPARFYSRVGFLIATGDSFIAGQTRLWTTKLRSIFLMFWQSRWRSSHCLPLILTVFGHRAMSLIQPAMDANHHFWWIYPKAGKLKPRFNWILKDFRML